MPGTCMASITRKPRKQKELASQLQRSVRGVVQRTQQQTEAAAAGGAEPGGAPKSRSGARKRKPRAGAEAGAAAEAAPGAEAGGAAAPAGKQGDVEMADAEPPAKQQRRATGPTTRQQQQLALAEAEAVPSAGEGREGSTSQTDALEGSGAHAPDQQQQQQPASSSGTAGSRRQDVAQPPRMAAAQSLHSNGSLMGASAAALDSQGQAGGKLRLQLMPLDTQTAAAQAAAGHHPFLELTLSTSKSLASVLRHLGAKWQQAAAAASGEASGGGAALFVHPPENCLITLRHVSWGGPDCDGQLKVRRWWGPASCRGGDVAEASKQARGQASRVTDPHGTQALPEPAAAALPCPLSPPGGRHLHHAALPRTLPAAL